MVDLEVWSLGGENQNVEVAGLNGQDQQALDSFRGIHGRPVRPRHVTLPGRPNTKLREDVARLRNRLAPRDLDNPFLALFNKPSNEKSTETRYFCEACTVSMPARDQDWQMHSNGLSHHCQILSLCEKGELGHIPQGECLVTPHLHLHDEYFT